MEQECKIGGESFKNRDVDRISELPEDLLVQVLSSLPTKNVVATSVLSKRWRSLWKIVPNLKFLSFQHRTFSEDVYRFFSLHKAPFLESLDLEVAYEYDELDIVVLIGIAFMRNVRKLVLDIYHRKEEPVRFPRVLCSCNGTLEILKLKGILLDFPSRVCLKSLRELHLHRVKFKDAESVCNLFCGCPTLQDLFARRISVIDVTTFTIASASLQRLTIEADFPRRGDKGYVVNAPSLKYLNIKGDHDIKYCLIENSTELVEAKIIDVYRTSNENILASLTSAKRLTLDLSPLEIKHPIGKVFYQLVSLELLTYKRKWWNLLSLMLHSSPKLQILKLTDPHLWGKKACGEGWEWEQPKCVPECLLFHLETFIWTRDEWEQADENDVATYILKYARRLKNATFSTKRIISEELEKVEKRREMMLNELASGVRSSNSCQLMFKSESK